MEIAYDVLYSGTLHANVIENVVSVFVFHFFRVFSFISFFAWPNKRMCSRSRKSNETTTTHLRLRTEWIEKSVKMLRPGIVYSVDREWSSVFPSHGWADRTWYGLSNTDKKNNKNDREKERRKWKWARQIFLNDHPCDAVIYSFYRHLICVRLRFVFACIVDTVAPPYTWNASRDKPFIYNFEC